ncbi:hypothetical protein A1O7_06090 [Cladophialophora yegresii CBS 114405]|uniref:Uncharacterized protein n=1 Tax=Cladophialophora yegresii CBS 114405 TaxID=1182544 RepID=W9VSD8_9EURO|nr:uncharacterized protein A1O7_06090 [Cladophialophora yegresii CBS 114405]EXJ58662.1 hypothetical protein A1O7_06090 [Cladophialophora yegresii CBS 114405]
MPRPPPATPSPAALTASSFQKALALYPSLVEKVYKTKLKNDGKKVTEALERDRWRFDELPASVAQRKQKANGDDNGNVNQANVRIRDGKAATAKSKAAGNANDTALELSKDEVERLVQWKM